MQNISGSRNTASVLLHVAHTTRVETITQLSDFALSISPTLWRAQHSRCGFRHLKTILAVNGQHALGNEAGRHLTDGNGNIAIGF